MGWPEELFGELLSYNIKKSKATLSFIRINFSSYCIAPINKNSRFMDASGHLSDLHLGSTSWFSCSALFLSQQSRTGNQQMENKLYICLKDIASAQLLLNYFYSFTSPLTGKVTYLKAGGKSCSCWNKTLSSQWIPERLDVMWRYERVRARYSPGEQWGAFLDFK